MMMKSTQKISCLQNLHPFKKKLAPNSSQCPKSPVKILEFVKSISINISDSEDSEDSEDYSEEEIKGGS